MPWGKASEGKAVCFNVTNVLQVFRMSNHERRVRTGAVHRGVGACHGVLGAQQAQRGRPRVVAARLQLHLGAQVLVQALVPALHSSRDTHAEDICR